VTGHTLDLSALIGMLMLSGIVVTNAIVLLDLVQHKIEAGDDVRTALIQGGRLGHQLRGRRQVRPGCGQRSVLEWRTTAMGRLPTEMMRSRLPVLPTTTVCSTVPVWSLRTLTASLPRLATKTRPVVVSTHAGPTRTTGRFDRLRPAHHR
jgi:hypothetical protein